MTRCDEITEELESRLETLNAQIEELQTRLENHDADPALLTQLYRQQEWTARQVAELHQASPQDWEEALDRAELAVEELNRLVCRCTLELGPTIVPAVPGAGE